MSYDFTTLTHEIKRLGLEFGFNNIAISKPSIPQQAADIYRQWLADNWHGDMYYLANNTEKRFHPQHLVDNCMSIISVSMPYLTHDRTTHIQRLQNNDAYISSYALGRDYHKSVKKQLNAYALAINKLLEQSDLVLEYRAFTDSAPIMEAQLATQAGLGWRGKNTLLINKNHGSLFFLGELLTNLPLIADTPTTEHCGSCSKCMQVCPTQAFIKPYMIDATKCISYLTIENHHGIPLEYREAIGNRIYGCDDCQLFCPWNKFATTTRHADYATRHNLDSITLAELLEWDEDIFKYTMQGSAIYRIGYIRFLRNIIIACGNSHNLQLLPQLQAKLITYTNHEYLAEHISWAISKLSITK